MKKSKKTLYTIYHFFKALSTPLKSLFCALYNLRFVWSVESESLSASSCMVKPSSNRHTNVLRSCSLNTHSFIKCSHSERLKSYLSSIA